MNAAIYVRVSSQGQEDNFSLDSQEAACRAWCAERGYGLAGVWREVFTGANLWDRPQLGAVRELVRAGEVGLVVAYAIDRLARDAAHLHILVDEAERHGASYQFATEQLDNSPIGKVMLSLRGFAAEIERQKIIERTTRGLKARADAGKLQPGKRALYGYRYPVEFADDGAAVRVVRDRYEIDPVTGPVVQDIFRRYVEGMPLLALCNHLNAVGIPSPNGAIPWDRANIHRVLKNTHYTGEAFAHRTRTTKERGRRRNIARPREEWIRLPDGVIPPLVDRSTFDAAQERARRNAREAARHNSDPEAYLLRGGYVVCGNCGKTVCASFSTRRDGRRIPDYRVTVSAEQHPTCRAVGMNAAILDAAAETYLKRVVLDRGVLGVMSERLRDKDTTAADLAATEAALANVKKRQATVANAVSLLDDEDAAAPLLAKLAALAGERKQLETDLAAIKGRADAAAATLAGLGDLRERADHLRANWHLLPYQAKRDLFAAIDLRVTLYPKDAPDRYTIESDADALLDAIVSGAGQCTQRNRTRRAPVVVRVTSRELAALAAD